MPYYEVENFGAGVDTRRNELGAPAGTLRSLVNAHITPGGEIEKRKVFALAFDLIDGEYADYYEHSFGLASEGEGLVTFKDAAIADPPGTWPTDGLWTWGYTPPDTSGDGYSGQSLTLLKLTGSDFANAVPDAVALDTLVDWDIYNGKIYLVAQGGPNGTPQHFYDGARVTGGQGKYIRTFKSKMYSVDDTTIYFSAPTDPTDWTGTGSGYIDSLTFASSTGRLNGLEIYYDNLAVFSTSGVQIWAMDADPDNNALIQVIRATGLLGVSTPIQYGDGDVMYLAADGIRSLRARDSSNAGSVSDVGSPIDAEIQKSFRSEYDNYVNQTKTLLDAGTGRFWLSFGEHIWVLSFFPGPKVTAWSQYIPEYDGEILCVKNMTQARQQPVVLADDGRIYVYGGLTGDDYDLSEAVATLPFMGLGYPAHEKLFKGLDIIATSSWEAEMAPQSNAPMYIPISTTVGSTIDHGRIGFSAQSGAISLKFRARDAKASTLASVFVHYDLAEAE